MDEIHKNGKIINYDGLKVIFIQGSNYEMGFQFGYLLKEELLQNRRAWLNFFKRRLGLEKKDFLETWEKIKGFIPKEYIQEIRGRADAVGLKFEDLAILESVGMVTSSKVGCSSMAAWGSATSNGELYHLRSQDLPLDAITDPITKKKAYENIVVVVRKPNDGFASIYPSSPFSIGIEGGFNNKGICIGWNLSMCKYHKLGGIPIALRQLMVLDHTSSLNDAVRIVNNNRNIGCSIVISDSKKPDAIVIEQNPNHYYVGSWDDPIESAGIFWKINDVVRRTNFFISPKLLKNQRNLLGPKFLKNLLSNQKLFLWLFSPLFRHYVGLSKGIEKNLGNLDITKTMDVLRSTYKGETDTLFSFIQKIFKIQKSWDQWVACPKTGDLLISFAQNGKNAFESPIHHINFFELLNSKK